MRAMRVHHCKRDPRRYPMPATRAAVDYGVASSPALDDRRVYFGGLDGVFHAFAAD